MINLVYIIIVHSSLKESHKEITIFWFIATLVTKKKEDLKYHNNRTCLKKGQVEAKGNVH